MGFLVAGERTLEALVFEGLAGGTGDIMGLFWLTVFGSDAHADGWNLQWPNGLACRLC